MLKGMDHQMILRNLNRYSYARDMFNYVLLNLGIVDKWITMPIAMAYSNRNR
jgi:hypothetical protein